VIDALAGMLPAPEANDAWFAVADLLVVASGLSGPWRVELGQEFDDDRELVGALRSEPSMSEAQRGVLAGWLAASLLSDATYPSAPPATSAELDWLYSYPEQCGAMAARYFLMAPVEVSARVLADGLRASERSGSIVAARFRSYQRPLAAQAAAGAVPLMPPELASDLIVRTRTALGDQAADPGIAAILDQLDKRRAG
jgi:hypothetical protein